MKAKIVFVILNYKTYEDTIELSKEIINEGIPNSIIIIVDNCSPNNSYDQLLDCFSDEKLVEIISSPSNDGYARGNNIGLRYAKKYDPEFVCIINNDVHFKGSIISQLIADIENNPQVGAISPVQKLPSGENTEFGNLRLYSFADDFFSYISPFHKEKMVYKATEQDGKLMKVGIVPGAFVFMRYPVLEQIGFFDESTFLYCEERFLSKGLEQIGKGCYIDISLSYIHAHSKTISQEKNYLQRMKLILESRRLFIERYSKHGKLKSFILYLVANMCIFIKWLFNKI